MRLVSLALLSVLALAAAVGCGAPAVTPEPDAGTTLCCLPYDSFDALFSGSTVRNLCTPAAQAEVRDDGGACPVGGSVCEFRPSDCPAVSQ
jgi:hypothetical protein